MGLVGGLYAATSAIDAGSSLVSSYQQSQAIKAQGNYQKNQLQFNAQVAELQAEDAIRRGDKEVKTKKTQTKQVIGSQRAALAAQGLDVNSDTSSLIQEDTAGLGAEDIATIKNNAWREAWGYKVQSTDYTGQANMAQISSKFNAEQTLLTGGLQFARDVGSSVINYYKYAPNNKSSISTNKEQNALTAFGGGAKRYKGY